MGSCALIGVHVKIWDPSLRDNEVLLCLEREDLPEMLKNFRTLVPLLPVTDYVPLGKSPPLFDQFPPEIRMLD